MDSSQKLLELINETNDVLKPLTMVNVKFTGIVPSAGEDTVLTVTGVAGRGYSGSVDLTYRRISLEEMVGGVTVRSPDALTPEGFLELLNNAYSLFITTIDVGAIEIPTLGEGESGQITLTADPESLGYFGEATITLEFGKSWLDQVIGRRNLNELTHPIRISYLQSARMMTWSKDFTCVRDAIKPNKTREYTDWPTLQKACASMGIPSWAPRYIADYSTAAIPDANPAFDRVVIQSDVGDARMRGRIYLHYNVLEEI